MESRLSPVSKIQACSTIAAILMHSLGARALEYCSIRNNLQIFARGKSATHPGVAAEPVRRITVQPQLRKMM